MTTQQVDDKVVEAQTIQSIRSTYQVSDVTKPDIEIDPGDHSISGSVLAKFGSSYRSCTLETTAVRQDSDHVVLLCNGSEPAKR